MSNRIEDYALLGNCVTAALVGRNGSIDWLALPRFDSPTCFAALLGTPENGRWLIAPDEPVLAVDRRYIEDTLVLETRFRTTGGLVSLTDFMVFPSGDECIELIRTVKGESGSVRMKLEAIFRFDYGSIVPWVRRHDLGVKAVAGPDAILFAAPLKLEGRGKTTAADFTVAAGETVSCNLVWHRSHAGEPKPSDPGRARSETEDRWRSWISRCEPSGQWHEAVKRSLLTLKGLTYAPTGGIVAAPTTSLPERPGGMRNWDYRYCWLRDATFTLYALLVSGYHEEARDWREWLLRAVAGSPSELQVMYGIRGERRLSEYELPWLAGFAGSRPVRIGNAAHRQRQMDVYGEVIDAFYSASRHGLQGSDDADRVRDNLLDWLEGHWQLPDSGIWEPRRPEQRHTHSAVMAWVAFDRAVKSLEGAASNGAQERWRRQRDRIHAEVCERGLDHDRGVFVQRYDGDGLDAALLRIPLVGFLPPDDPRVVRTAEAIARELTVDGFVLRYRSDEEPDGLPAGEGTFLICSFWLADNLVLMGRREQAQALFERLLALRNDVGLLAEEYDPRGRRQLGNFPQAFSHVGLINTAHNLGLPEGPAARRASP